LRREIPDQGLGGLGPGLGQYRERGTGEPRILTEALTAVRP
jgi:hypothetical protein